MSEPTTDLSDGFSHAMHLLRDGHCEAAKIEFRDVYNRAEAAGEGSVMAACLCEIAWCCYKLGEPEQGVECIMAAKLLWERHGNTVELARALAVKAILFLDLGFSDEAFELSAQALVLAEAGDDAPVLAFTLCIKGIVVTVCREGELGIQLIERAVTIAAEQANGVAEAYYMLNLGFCHAKLAEEAEVLGETERAMGEREAAIELTEVAIERAEAGGDRWTLRVALGNTAEMLALQGRYDVALRYLDRIAALPGDSGPSLRTHYLYTLGDVLIGAGQLAQAHSAVTEALALADATHQIDHQVNAAHRLAAILEAQGDATAALAMHRRFHALYVQQSGETSRRRARIEEIRSQTEQWRSRAAILADQALSDPLTGIANRRSFDQILNRLAGAHIAIAIVDIDNFKTVNDRFSHIAGDAVIQRVARALVAQIGPHGHAARLGGEEFALIFPDAPEAIAFAICEGIRVAIGAINWSDVAPGLVVTVSIGLAAGDGSAPSGELMQSADNRLYIAKANGRDRVIAADSPVIAPTHEAGDRRRWRA